MFKIIFTTLLLLIASFFIIQRAVFEIKKEEVPEKTFTTIYIQDKEIAQTSDCSAVTSIQVEINKEKEVYTQIAEYLFENELKLYAKYERLRIENRVLQIYMESDVRPDGRPLTSLSSCEAAHLYSVLENTFTQFEEINLVQLFAGENKLEF